MMAEVEAEGVEAEDGDIHLDSAASVICDPPGIVDVSVGASLNN